MQGVEFSKIIMIKPTYYAYVVSYSICAVAIVKAHKRELLYTFPRARARFELQKKTHQSSVG